MICVETSYCYGFVAQIFIPILISLFEAFSGETLLSLKYYGRFLKIVQWRAGKGLFDRPATFSSLAWGRNENAWVIEGGRSVRRGLLRIGLPDKLFFARHCLNLNWFAWGSLSLNYLSYSQLFNLNLS